MLAGIPGIAPFVVLQVLSSIFIGIYILITNVYKIYLFLKPQKSNEINFNKKTSIKVLKIPLKQNIDIYLTVSL